MSATDVSVHRNIVYATASRFSPPHLLDGATTRPGAVQCPQNPGLLEQAMGTGEIPMSEDCLTLDVYVPTATAGGLPVLVWIHGGAFTNGTAHASWYDGSNLARRGCVVVGINYRLGAFGFTGTADLGLLDQITALQWVHNNIGSFGGDASNVTIFGESAGGCSVLALMAAPRAAGLFHRAWSMSPSIGQLRSTARAEQSRGLLEAELGVANGAPAEHDALLARTTDEIVDAQSRLFRDPKDIVTMFSPTIGGDLLPIDTHQRIARDPRPLVIGTMRDESRLWVAMNPLSAQLTIDDVMEQFAARFGSQADRAWQAYSQVRPNSTPAEMLAALQSDESFRVPAWRVIDSRDEAGGTTWSYFFSWPTPVFDGILGACHGLDIPFVFDNLSAANVEFFIGASPTHRHLADTLADSLATFAREGTVNWPTTSRNRTTLQIDETNRVYSDPERTIYDLWNDHASRVATDAVLP